ncbi:hypothetical protein P171DRAFT_487665 [Karstenula rhodostoma CBS 690.94]|uniref:Uncharacterized protein n=1 Tax=Karstenula rhodostoma CBS 690.94 TaxID=1392251 RepID=A0A9P4PEF2_9PLEO|nr:hypothetical protein P171DRAFT_487665 [Karstenula rhodostoma CBS 690.94]
MASGKANPAGSPQLTAEEFQGETTPKLQTQGSVNMDTNAREPESRALPGQAAEGNDFATKQSPELAQVGAADLFAEHSPDQEDTRSTSAVYLSTSSSDGGIQLHDPGNADWRVNPTFISATVGDASTPYLSTPPTSISEVTSSSLLQKSQIDGPYHFRERNPGRDSIKYDEGDDATEYGEEGCVKYNKGNDDANESLSCNDDAEDVLNPPVDGGDGFVVPHVDGITSFNADLDGLMEVTLDGVTPPRRGASPQSVRRASSPTGQVMSHLATPGSISSIANPHVKFATNASLQDTPFNKTMKYFKQFKDKENTPSKSRRNASLPEEIAELAKDAQQEGIEDEAALWDQYRELDFAPLDSVMDGQIAGDLIMNTPARKTVASIAENSKTIDMPQVVSSKPKMRGLPGDNKNNDQTSAPPSLDDKVIKGHANETGPTYLVDIPGHFDDAFELRFRSRASVGLIASFLRERGEALDASKDDIDRLVEEFLECPSNFTIRGHSDTESLYADSDRDTNSDEDERTLGAGSTGCDDNDYDHDADDHAQEKQVISYIEDPGLVKALGMVPGAMFWIVAQPVARCSNKIMGTTSKAFDTVLQKLTGLSLDEPPTSE